MIEIESTGVPIKAWVEGVPVEDEAKTQLQSIAKLPIVWPHLAVMADVHLGIGATVGSVVPTRGAIIPAAVGGDIGCGMGAIQLSLKASDLPDNLAEMRTAIEAAVPHGRTNNGASGDRGAWGHLPANTIRAWGDLSDRYHTIVSKHPKAKAHNDASHLGTLGSGNHFIEVCLDTDQCVWIMLHSGSRGVGNRIGTYFIALAREDMHRVHGNMPEDKDLAYLMEGTEHFADYVEAVLWAQDYAAMNRKLMMTAVRAAVGAVTGFDSHIWSEQQAVQCHHNYVQRERHFGEDLWLTRKGAVSARKGELGIIPGSMGAKSFIVRGKGNAASFHSCSHGAGRAMSRNAAKKTFTVADHVAATAGIECRKDAGVVDETPGAYKSIDAVMAAQSDLVEVVATLRQVLCVKG